MVKNRQMSVILVGHLSDRLSVVVSVRAEPHKGYVTERVWSLAAYVVPTLGSRGKDNMFT